MRARGFTLLEVLLVLALVIALLAGVAGLSERVLEHRASTRAWVDSQNVAELVISSLERELSTSTLGDASHGPGVKGSATSIEVTSRGVLGSAGDLVHTEFSYRASTGEIEGTRRPVGAGAELGLADEVAAFDEDAVDGDGAGNEAETSIMSEPLPSAGFAERSVLGRGIGGLRILYRDRDGWVETFDSSQLGRLPLAVQVEIWFGEPEAGASPTAAVTQAVHGQDAQGGASLQSTGSAAAVSFPARAPDRVRVIAIPDAAAETDPDSQEGADGGGGGA